MMVERLTIKLKILSINLSSKNSNRSDCCEHTELRKQRFSVTDRHNSSHADDRPIYSTRRPSKRLTDRAQFKKNPDSGAHVACLS